MVKLLVSIIFVLAALRLHGQSFDVTGLQENYKGNIGETIKVPLKLRNTTDRPLTLIIRKASAQIGTSQKNFFCIDDNCLESRVEEYVLKLEAGQTSTSVNVALEAGLAQGVSAVTYLVFNRSNPSDAYELDLSFTVEERSEKQNIYSSNQLMLRDVYPNPVIDNAFVDYEILNQQVKAKIVIHNLLGNAIEEYPLPVHENKVKIRAEALTTGIYFYTLYIDNEGVITRKLVVRK